MKQIAAIVLAAGKGTRMKSEKPKVLFKIAEKMLVQRVIDAAEELKPNKIAVVVGYKKDEVIKRLNHYSNTVFIEQKEQNGTGHAVIVTKKEFENFEGNILLLCGDVPLLKAKTLKKLVEKHNKKNAACTVLTAIMDDALKYGRIVRNKDNSVKQIVEFKDANQEQRKIKEINTGIYCFNANDLFNSLNQISNNNKQNEYYLTDTLEILNKEGKLVSSVIVDDNKEVSGVNSQLQLANLENKLYKEIKKYWLSNGVSIENPDTVIIGENVKIEPEVYIAANNIIKGNTVIRKGSYIGPNCYLNNTAIKQNSILKGFNVFKNCQLPVNSVYDFYEKDY